ncbi:MAG TPA: peroxiredoxin [Anaeromyxobacteraceae bacterium]|nr:peroxiredoxin [Anaeromyxobacteraceae bacterium]
MVKLLQPAPEFRARAVSGAGEVRELALSDLRGRWVVLFFYPGDFTPVCPTEIREFSQRLPEFQALAAEVMGCSVDSVESHRAWIAGGLGPVAIPLLADPDRSIARAYGALLEPPGVAARATFAVDPAGMVQYAAFHNLSVGRSVSETLRVLEALRSGERTPAEWRPGQPTLGR